MLAWVLNLGFAGSGAAVLPPTTEGVEFTLPINRAHFTLKENKPHFELPINRAHWTMPERD